ncbi:MAG: polysaccharide deacetylase family protein [Chloroflexota bacterium]|nr:polysaccharide deacetylase family protein [Chloroflexota bacterium]
MSFLVNARDRVWRPRQLAATLSMVAALPLIVATGLMPVAAVALATVVGTDAVNIRACPSLACEVIASAPLGYALTVTGEPRDGFTPVSYGNQVGYAYGLYLATDPASVPYLTHGLPGCKRLALIFNIGIGDEPATGIFDTLKAQIVPATMFPMGWWARERPDLVARMNADGFVVGSHGDQRRLLTELSDADVVREVRASRVAIDTALGSPPGPWFTPYAAAADPRVRALIAAEGFLPVSWTVPADDYGPNATATGVYDRVMRGVTDGAIIEMHLDGPASARSTGVALPWLIADLRAEGYQFVTIPQMTVPCAA